LNLLQRPETADLTQFLPLVYVSTEKFTDLIVAIACGLASFRFGLPMTIRSTFYPILGEYCWGWMGDVIDGYSIVMTVAGVCTSLGMGAIQIGGTSQNKNI
jgi:choline-glycine betaine transporter